MSSKKKKEKKIETFQVVDGEVEEYFGPPASSPDSREEQMINLAVNLAEKQLRDGTASSQVIVHYLKLANTRERVKLEMESRLMEAKVEQLESAKETAAAYKEAIEAMKRYGR